MRRLFSSIFVHSLCPFDSTHALPGVLPFFWGRRVYLVAKKDVPELDCQLQNWPNLTSPFRGGGAIVLTAICKDGFFTSYEYCPPLLAKKKG